MHHDLTYSKSFPRAHRFTKIEAETIMLQIQLRITPRDKIESEEAKAKNSYPANMPGGFYEMLLLLAKNHPNPRGALKQAWHQGHIVSEEFETGLNHLLTELESTFNQLCAA